MMAHKGLGLVRFKESKAKQKTSNRVGCSRKCPVKLEEHPI